VLQFTGAAGEAFNKRIGLQICLREYTDPDLAMKSATKDLSSEVG
jgi:hypothetical protein